MEDFFGLSNEKDNTIGVDTEFLKKQISILENKKERTIEENNLLTKYSNQLNQVEMEVNSMDDLFGTNQKVKKK